MCGGSDSATKQAQENERLRKIEVANATNAIERAFGGPERESQLSEFINALRGQFTTEARKQKEQTSRRAKFATARSGLTGGSAAADLNVDLGKTFQSGILKGERLSQEALADLKASDIRSKQDLLALAQSGINVTSAAQQSAEALKSNIAGARSRTSSESLGDIFSGIESTLVGAEEAAQRRRGLKESELFAAPFSRSS
jgi:hypothetical protein